MNKSNRFIQRGCGGFQFLNPDGSLYGTLDDDGNLIPAQSEQQPQPFAAEHWQDQPRTTGGQFVEATDVEKLSDGALESLLDDVVDEALKRQAKRQEQDPLEYD